MQPTKARAPRVLPVQGLLFGSLDVQALPEPTRLQTHPWFRAARVRVSAQENHLTPEGQSVLDALRARPLLRLRRVPLPLPATPPAEQLSLLLELPDEGATNEAQAAAAQQRDADLGFLLDHAVQLLGHVLEEALETLAGWGSAAVKAHDAFWLFGPAQMHVSQDGQYRKVAARNVPGTFHWYCAALGLDPDRLQAETLTHLDRHAANAVQRELDGQLAVGRSVEFTKIAALARQLMKDNDV